MRLAGRTAVITGAAGGIGRAVAVALASRGARVALADRDSAGLHQTEAMCRALGADAEGYLLDVSDVTAVAELPQRVLDRFGSVAILVNNAGVALRGRFEEVKLSDFEWLFSINFWGVVRMTHAFLPILRREPEAQLVNLSSLFGLVAPPGQSAYSASKFAVRGFSEALRKELEGSSVRVTVVHPGGVATRIAKDARRSGTATADEARQEDERFARLLRMSPEEAGEMIVSAIERRTRRLLVGKDARIASIVERIMPVSYLEVARERCAMIVLTDVLTGLGCLILLVVAGLMAFTALSARRAERLVPADGEFLEVPGGRLHYTDRGTGPAIILIHGLGGQLRNFPSPLIDRLARSHRVIAIDRPGSGYSTFAGAYPDLWKQAAMISALVERLALGPVTLAGHSLGGALSLAMTLARPDLVSSLTLLAPLTQHVDDAPRAFRILTIRSALLRWLVAWTVVAPFGRLAGKARRGPVFSPDDVPEDFEIRGGGALVYRPKGFDAASRDIQGVPAALPDMMARYHEIAKPVSVLFGRGDRILDPKLNGTLFVAQVPGARCTLAEGGHMFPFTRPAFTADWIEAAMARGRH